MSLRRLLPLATAGALLLMSDLATAQTWQSVSASRRVHGEKRLRVDVEFAVGTFRLRPTEGNALYHADILYDAEFFEPRIEYDAERGRLDLRVTPEIENGLDLDYDDTDQHLTVELSRSVPTVLELKFGAARAELDLGGIPLERAEIKTGASESVVSFEEPNPIACDRLEVGAGAADFTLTQLGNARCRVIEVAGGIGDVTLDFTGQWDSAVDTRVEIVMGFGDVNLRLPIGLGIEVDIDRLFAGFEGSGFVKRGSRYFSHDYDGAAQKLRLDIKAALGDVNVEWVEGSF
ncbi:MAG: hypothetical protein JSW43_00650 [Gemmatimonadota bacterium]|nr:MAG: hypothetical protein JSW43_00650 [Gemmatimonadota bacterium]